MNKSSILTKGGIFTALTFILLYLTSILPTSKIALMTLSSAFIPFSIISLGYRNSILVYVSSSLLTFFFIDKKIAITYILFLGLYGFIKSLIERLNKVYLENFFKILFFNSFLLIFYYLYKGLFLTSGEFNFPLLWIFISSQIIFLIYDYALTLIINFYMRKFKNKLF